MRIPWSTAAVRLVVLLLCATAVGSADAQNKQKAGAKQPDVKEAGRAAPKRGGAVDDFSPVARPQSKPASETVGADASAPGEVGESSGEDSAGAGSAPADARASGAAATSAAPSVGQPQRAGVARICLVTTRAQVSDGDAAQAAEAVRHTFNSFLTGPTIETVALAARLPSQAAEEARRSGCGYLLHTSLTHKKSGGGGLFGRAVSRVGSSVYIPGGSSVGGAVARSAATAGVYTAAELAGSIKAKDELVLDFRLEATDGARPPLARTDKAKAKADGEDLLTTLVERAADVIATAVMK